MENLERYIAKKHAHLKNNYNPEFGEPHDRCEDIARDIALLLEEHGKGPSLVRFEKDNGMLQLPIFDNKSEWGYHVACICEGVVYDPILKRPMRLKEYCHTVFGELVPFMILKPR